MNQQECTKRSLLSAARSYVCFGAVSSKTWACTTFSDRLACVLFCHPRTLDSEFLRRKALSPLPNTSTGCFTKRGFHKWILTCYILELQREPLRGECLLLENRERWLLQFLPHSWRGCRTPCHLTWMISAGSWLVHSCDKEMFFFYDGVCACHACAWVFRFFCCAIARKIKSSRGKGGGLWECLVMR